MYELNVHRYRELKNFCLQYNYMKERIRELSNPAYSDGKEEVTSKTASKLSDYKYAVELIEKTAFNVGKFPGEKILKIVTEDMTLGSVCSDTVEADYYIHKFFWMLSESKGI